MSRRPKPPISAWIVRERKRLGLKPPDLAARLTAMGLPVADGTPRTWEAGRSPSPENIEGLERIFGTVAPNTETSGNGSTLAPEVSALITSISALIEEIRSARRERADLEERVLALELAAKLQGRSPDGANGEPAAPPSRAG